MQQFCASGWLNASESQVSLATVIRQTWFGRLAIPMPSTAGAGTDIIKDYWWEEEEEDDVNEQKIKKTAKSFENDTCLLLFTLWLALKYCI